MVHRRCAILKGRVIAALALVICLATLVWSAKVGWAHVVSIRAQAFVESAMGAELGSRRMQQHFDRAAELADQALSFDPGNPHLHMLRARVHREQAVRAFDTRNRLAAREQALTSYQTAAELTPRWPFAWAGIAEMSEPRSASQLDALGKAMVLGPHEPAVILVALDIVLKPGARPAPETRQTVMTFAAMNQRKHAFIMVERAMRYGQLFYFCDDLALSFEGERACRIHGWTPLTESSNGAAGQ